jgi:hypothetical protein
MKRYLEVEVSRRQVTSVFLEVDDETPLVREALRPGGDRSKLFCVAREHVEGAVRETIQPRDWEDNDCMFDASDTEVEAVKEVPEREARQYRVYATPGPTAADLRAALEAAGQKVLL